MPKLFTFLIIITLPFTITAQCWQSIDGHLHTSAVKSDGTLWGWGSNEFGQLGNGTNNITNDVPLQIGNAFNWQAVSAAGFNTFAIKADGTLWVWGFNNLGQMGVPDVTSTNVPVQVGTGTNWLAVSAGFYHTLAIKTDGTLWACGKNEYGELGDGTFIDKNYFIQIGTSSDWEIITAGNNRSHAIKSDGTLWAWGSNFSGGLGDGTLTNRNFPVQIGFDAWASVDNGHGAHVLGIKSDGTLWSWGYNFWGQLGHGNQNNLYVPTQIGTDAWAHIALGSAHSLAIKSDGTLWSWGRADQDQLGTGTTADAVHVPTQIGTALDWTNVFAGVSHSMAVKNNGTLWVWGYNYYGQLGVPSSPVSQILPVATVCPELLDVSQFNRNIFSIYPNPASSTINIQASHGIIDMVIIVDVSGKIVLKQTGNFENIDILNLQNGIYLLKAFSEGRTFNGKFVKN